MKTLLSVLAVSALAATACYGEDTFLEGFPDVPLVAGVQEVVEERVVFDTPAGTVAQTVVTSNAAPKPTLDRFSNALAALGWACKTVDGQMGCDRDGAKLGFRITSAQGETTRIMLRLEPVQ